MAGNASQFLDSLKKSGLVSLEVLDDASRKVIHDPTATSDQIAAELVESKVLTPFQAEQLLAGRGEECMLAGRFKILEQLGAGGMGTVYKAVDARLGRNVAIKVLPEKSISDPDAVARFQREAMALARLTHPNIVQAYDSGEEHGKHFLVMECVEGKSIARILAEQHKIPPTRAADHAYQAALGLAHAHAKGLVHRDLKPSNLFITKAGELKILDLGLARFLSDQVGDSTLTRDGSGLGTPDYMPAEQYLNARQVDARSDVYALGCTLYHMIAGQVPFPGSSLKEKFAAHETKEPRPLEELCPDVPAGLALVVRRMMAKRPVDRFQTAAEVSEALAPYVAGSSASISDIRSTANWQGSQLQLSGFTSQVRRQRRSAYIAVTTVVAIAALAFGIWKVFDTRSGDRLADQESEKSGQTGDYSEDSAANSGAAETNSTSDGNDTKETAEKKSNGKNPEAPPADPNILTVAQDGSAQFRTINEALKKAAPGMTIRVLDDATYQEQITISVAAKHAGIALESPRHATIECMQRIAISINNVPRVRIKGFRIEPKGVAGISAVSHVEGLELVDLVLQGTAIPSVADANGACIVGVAVEQVELEKEDPPVIIRNCTIRKFTNGIRISGLADDYKSAWPSRRIMVVANTLADLSTGLIIIGHVHQVQVTGNRFVESLLAMQLETLIDGAEDILFANNTTYNCQSAFRLWDEKVRGKNIQVINNLVLGKSPSPDMLFLDSGGKQGTPRGPGDGKLVPAAWQWKHNWRETSPPTGNDVAAKSWIPAGPTDVMRPEISGIERDSSSPDFLRPAADSELAIGGVGQEDPALPSYVGALPPVGITPWDWQKTWNLYHPSMVLTVSKSPEDGGAFRSIQEALKQVTRPGMTIRILDNATYDESCLITDGKACDGLTIESPLHATMAPSQGGRALLIVNVPRLSVRGLHFKLTQDRLMGIVVAGTSPAFLLEDSEFTGAATNAQVGVSLEQAPLAPDDPPMVCRNCTFNDLAYGIQILGLNNGNDMRCSNVLVQGTSMRHGSVGILVTGLVSDVVVAGNRINDMYSGGIGISDMRPGSGRIVIANNSVQTTHSALAFDEPIAKDVVVEVVNNLVLTERAPDFALNGKSEALNSWRIHHNVRQVPVPAENDPAVAQWVKPSKDTVVPVIPLVSTDSKSADFLRPSGELPAGDTLEGLLPAYVGALPPAGTDPWDWNQTYAKLREHFEQK